VIAYVRSLVRTAKARTVVPSWAVALPECGCETTFAASWTDAPSATARLSAPIPSCKPLVQPPTDRRALRPRAQTAQLPADDA
jgi:hypothetical protein